MSIITLTVNPALDKSTSVSRVTPVHKLRCKQPKYDPGGGGINVARVINRLGGNATAIFQSSGPAGILVQQLLKDEQVNHLTYATKEWTRENLIVTDESTHQQYRFGMPGPLYSPDEIIRCVDFIQGIKPKPQYLVLSGSLSPGMPGNFYATICEWANKERIKTILDTSGEPLLKAIESGVFLVKPNLRELSQLAGKESISAIEQEQLAQSLIARKKAQLVVVSLGARGAMLAAENDVFYVSPPTVETKSTVGAGDSMVGGMVCALEQKYSYLDILKYGVACGTAATMNAGTELCQKKDVDTIFNRLKGSLAHE